MCTRILYETGSGGYITGRSMDWNDPTAKTALWIFPRGVEREGGVGEGSLSWVSKLGSVVVSFYDLTSADGMNEAGVVGNMLYLAESDYGASSNDPKISVGAWLQYVLDLFSSVAEVVEGIRSNPLTIVAADAPNGRPASVHFSLSDSSGDSAVFEFIEGELVIHHSPECKVMTNSPIYDEQGALNAYWELIGGQNMLPGTISAADRFVRASYNLKSSPKYEEEREAIASVFSQMRSIGIPLGISDPDRPNLSSTLWRTVADQSRRRYFFDSVLEPSVIWVDFDLLDFSPGGDVLRLDSGNQLGGEVSAAFSPAEPFKFLAP